MRHDESMHYSLSKCAFIEAMFMYVCGRTIVYSFIVGFIDHRIISCRGVDNFLLMGVIPKYCYIFYICKYSAKLSQCRILCMYQNITYSASQ